MESGWLTSPSSPQTRLWSRPACRSAAPRCSSSRRRSRSSRRRRRRPSPPATCSRSMRATAASRPAGAPPSTTSWCRAGWAAPAPQRQPAESATYRCPSAVRASASVSPATRRRRIDNSVPVGAECTGGC